MLVVNLEVRLAIPVPGYLNLTNEEGDEQLIIGAADLYLSTQRTL
ncbi:hypothetical protein [Aliiruegeria sabulilitoris]|nr:hypothetical protein [Aliiruegeria sabulilitoris]